MIDKGNDFFPEIQKVLLETKTIDHALFLEPYAPEEAQKVMGKYLFENSHYVGRVYEHTENPKGFVRNFVSKTRVPAFEYRFTTTSSHVLDAFNPERRVWVSTISPQMAGGLDDSTALQNPDTSWGWLVDQGANILLTDYPTELIRYLNEGGFR